MARGQPCRPRRRLPAVGVGSVPSARPSASLDRTPLRSASASGHSRPRPGWAPGWWGSGGRDPSLWPLLRRIPSWFFTAPRLGVQGCRRGAGGSGVGGGHGRGQEAGLRAGEPCRNASAALCWRGPFPAGTLQLPQVPSRLPEDAPRSTLAAAPPPPAQPLGGSLGAPSCLLQSPRPRPAPLAAVPLKARSAGAALLSRQAREARRR